MKTKRFKRVYVEITNVCNLNCSFCSKSARESHSMTAEQFEYVVKSIKPYTDYAALHIKGEPMVHRDFSDILNIASKYQINIQLTTNGVLLERYLDDILNNSVRQINISLQALSCPENGFINKERYFDTLMKLINTDQKPYVQLRIWNADKITDQSFYSNEVTNFLYNKFQVTKEQITELADNKKSIKLHDKTFLSLDNEFEWPSLNGKHSGETGFCYGMKNMAGILSDGTVVPCCLDGEGIINLGNIFRQSFAQIISSQRCNDMLRGFEQNKLTEELCRHCSYRQRFNKSTK